jgi:hypothetical protein
MALFKIEAQNIANGSISTDKVDSVFTATYATYAAVAANLTPRIASVNVANSTWHVLDDTAVNTAGGYLVITGANFQSGAIVTIGDTLATSTSYVDETTLRAQVPAKDAGSYTVYVQNPDGGTAIRVLGAAFSNTPIWGTSSTLENQNLDTAFGVNLSANSDSSITYANTTALPAGTTLLSNGYFYGTVTGITEETTYAFTVEAIDAENQESPREFSLTVTVAPTDPYFSDVSLLMLGNSTVTDSSSNSFTLYQSAGTVTINTSIKKYGAGSLYFNGSSYLVSDNSSKFTLGTGDFTIEMWIYPTDAQGLFGTMVAIGNPDSGGLGIQMAGQNQLYIRIVSTASDNNFLTSGTVLQNQWHHIAYTRQSGLVRAFLNGTLLGSKSMNFNITAQNVYLGRWNAAYPTWTLGYMDDLRITKGVARYTSSFTAPTEELPSA